MIENISLPERTTKLSRSLRTTMDGSRVGCFYLHEADRDTMARESFLIDGAYLSKIYNEELSRKPNLSEGPIGHAMLPLLINRATDMGKFFCIVPNPNRRLPPIVPTLTSTGMQILDQWWREWWNVEFYFVDEKYVSQDFFEPIESVEDVVE